MSKKVLVVEDDKALLEPLTNGITAAGYKVAVAKDGQAGLQQILTENPDLVLLDLNLPKTSGGELLGTIRANKQIWHTPVIILTNDTSQDSINDSLNKAAPAYFIKAETSLDTIVKAIQFHLA